MNRRFLTVIVAAAAWCATLLPVFAQSGALYCFCNMPNTPTFGSCAGHTIHIGTTVSSDAACNTNCQAVGLQPYKAVADYNNAGTCDWVFDNKTCFGPNENQQNDTCKAERKAWVDAGSAAKDQAINSAQRGSTISLMLPLSDASPQNVIGRIIKAALGFVGSLALVMFIYGGVRWMTAAGSAENVTKAKATLVWAALGLVMIFAAYAIVNTLVSTISGGS